MVCGRFGQSPANPRAVNYTGERSRQVSGLVRW
jgi:hypothetical protein